MLAEVKPKSATSKFDFGWEDVKLTAPRIQQVAWSEIVLYRKEIGQEKRIQDIIAGKQLPKEKVEGGDKVEEATAAMAKASVSDKATT